MCLFRFKLWWMTQRMGTCGRDIPLETQFLLVEIKDTSESGESNDASTIYTVFLPLLEGQFRAVLQGNDNNELEICLESGEYIMVMQKLMRYIENCPILTLSRAIASVCPSCSLSNETRSCKLLVMELSLMMKTARYHHIIHMGQNCWGL